MSISIRATVGYFAVAITFVILAGWATQYYAYVFKPAEFHSQECHGIIRFFYLDGEANFPTWYQSMTLLMASALLFLAGATEQLVPFRRSWRIISAIFLFLSMDEAACFHEAVGNQLSRSLNVTGVLGHGYAWIVPGAIAVIAFSLWSLRFLLHLPKSTRRNFILAGAVYCTGSLVWELASAWFDFHYGARNIGYLSLTIGEELFECTGVALFIHAILLHLKDSRGNVGHEAAEFSSAIRISS